MPVRRPLIIAGAVRTGTTVIHRLIAQDPQFMAPYFWEHILPYPPGRPQNWQNCDSYKEALDHCSKSVLNRETEKINTIEICGLSGQMVFHDISASHLFGVMKFLVTPFPPSVSIATKSMMTSSNVNIFRVTGPLCGEFTGHRGEFPSQRPMTRIFGVFFELCLNKRRSKQSRRRRFETPSRPSWGHCNVPKWCRVFSICIFPAM